MPAEPLLAGCDSLSRCVECYRRCARGLADFDQKFRLTTWAVYVLPQVGFHGAANVVLNGWTWNTMAALDSGLPLTNWTDTTTRYFNKAAFAPLPSGTYERFTASYDPRVLKLFSDEQ